MNTIKKIRALLSLGLILSGVLTAGRTSSAQARRAIVPSDCVTVRHFLREGFHASILLDPEGTKAAYLVQSPNLQSNVNDVDLDVTPVGAANGDTLHLLADTKLSQPRWLDNGKSLAVIATRGGRVSIVKVAAPSGRVTVLVRASQDISEYSISEDGRTIVYAVEAKTNGVVTEHTGEEDAHGYRVVFEKQSSEQFPKRELFVTRRTFAGWSKPKRLVVRLPFLNKAVESFPYVIDLRLSLAPDGRSLAFTYVASLSGAPEGWAQSPSVRTITASIAVVQLTAVINLTTGTASLPFESPWAYTVPFWSQDSRSFIISAVSPVNSSWEKEDVEHHRPPNDAVHQFEVEPESGKVRLIQSDLHGLFESPLSWEQNGDLLLHTGDETLSHMQFEKNEWKETSRVNLSMPGRFKNADLASDGKIVVGDYETPSTPPGFFVYRIGDPTFQRLVSLNPQFENLTLAPYREVQWDTSTGYHASGFLFMPPDYDSRKTYPLVIHAYPAVSNFFCDSGVNHEPSFAPQPLANAGIMYLIRILSDGMHRGEEQEHYPTGFPGRLAEAAFQNDVWDSAVARLTADGLVDPKKVGIIGFSRSGWYAEFALTHGRTHYAAATVADNVQYSLGEYWMIHSDAALKSGDTMFGGPPYGDTLKNWLQHSISFNLPKIQASVLMEVMGYGTHETNVESPPSNLTLKSEVFVGLNHLSKPVEMYYYPLESHQPDHPQARLASLQRNLDWYRFWLQGYERPSPEDPDQYKRWEHLRELRDAETKVTNAKTAGQ